MSQFFNLSQELKGRHVKSIAYYEKEKMISINYRRNFNWVPIQDDIEQTLAKFELIFKEKMDSTTIKLCKDAIAENWYLIEDFVLKDEGKKQSKNKDKNQKEITNKKISIKKYSQNGKGILYESVIIGEESKLVYLNKNSKLQFVNDITRVNDILIPDDTIDTQNPIPFVFDSKEDLEQCLEEAKKRNSRFTFLEGRIYK